VGCGGCWGLLGGGEKGQGSDVVMEFPSGAPTKDDIQEAPPRNQIESPGGFLRLQVHERAAVVN
jgi:hypothetical protein